MVSSSSLHGREVDKGAVWLHESGIFHVDEVDPPARQRQLASFAYCPPHPQPFQFSTVCNCYISNASKPGLLVATDEVSVC